MADIDFSNWPKLGQGSERTCYQDPDNPLRVVKVSPSQNAKQTLREIEYFQHLIKNKVPFDHIPLYYGSFKKDGVIGIIQEMIPTTPGSTEPAQRLREFLDGKPTEAEIAELHRALAKLKDYLMKWDIILCDLQISNVVIQYTPEGMRLVILDGLGATELIPLSRWFRNICHQKTTRHWKKFCRKITRRNSNVTF